MKVLERAHWLPTGDELAPTTIVDQLQRHATASASALALIAFSTNDLDAVCRWTYEQLLDDACAGASALLDLFQPGERIAIWAPNVAEWVQAYLSAAVAGLQVVPLNPQFNPSEASDIVADASCAGILVVEQHRNRPLREMAESIKAESRQVRHVVRLEDWRHMLATSTPRELPVVAAHDIALVQYTSGTTGRPKGAMLSHQSLAHASTRSGSRLGIRPGDVYVNPFPLFHVGGTVGAIGVCVAAGAALAPLPAFGADDMIRLLESAGATMTAGVPTVLQTLLPRLRSRPDLARQLRVVSTAAAPVSAQLVEQYAEIGVAISIAYGQTECPTICRTAPGDDAEQRATTVGQPVDGLEVKIVEMATGMPVETGCVGELWVRGTSVMAGYLDRPADTADVLMADGWLRTGDLGTMSPSGHCRIVGRHRELIIRGGENVYPREVEEVLATHPAIREVAVVGRPDDSYGERVVAVVAVEPGTSLDWEELEDFAREHLASFKVPRAWQEVPALPRNAAGKVEKFRLCAPEATT